MDTTDPEVDIDITGLCSYCRRILNDTRYRVPASDKIQALEKIIVDIKNAGKKKNYDCILGLSGGVDSSYVAFLLKQYDLRPLVVHVDGGWNSELAVSNIQSLVDYLGSDLYTHVVDWKEMRSLQVAYLKSGIANQDVPQDHVFFAVLYKIAAKRGIKYIISGSNIATESVFPERFFGNAMDSKNLNAIYKRFGDGILKTYQRIGFFDYYIRYPYLMKIKTVAPLNYINYNKADALSELINKINYKPYPRKHGESIFTKFYQNHYLPQKYGYDKRRLHLSSQILSAQITRAQAIIKLQEPLYDPKELISDLNYVARKLNLEVNELNDLINSDYFSHYEDYPNWTKNYKRLRSIYRLYLKIKSYMNYA